jgi:hypothetical protein
MGGRELKSRHVTVLLLKSIVGSMVVVLAMVLNSDMWVNAWELDMMSAAQMVVHWLAVRQA